jgi:hypothetical protein
VTRYSVNICGLSHEVCAHLWLSPTRYYPKLKAFKILHVGLPRNRNLDALGTRGMCAQELPSLTLPNTQVVANMPRSTGVPIGGR